MEIEGGRGGGRWERVGEGGGWEREGGGRGRGREEESGGSVVDIHAPFLKATDIAINRPTMTC